MNKWRVGACSQQGAPPPQCVSSQGPGVWASGSHKTARSLLPLTGPALLTCFLIMDFRRERGLAPIRNAGSCLIGQSLWGHRKQRKNP